MLIFLCGEEANLLGCVDMNIVNIKTVWTSPSPIDADQRMFSLLLSLSGSVRVSYDLCHWMYSADVLYIRCTTSDALANAINEITNKWRNCPVCIM